MVFDTSYTDKSTTKAINALVGNSFSWRERFNQKGIGSKRMMIEKVSPNMNSYLNNNADISYANIELRPRGILIALTKGLSRYTWALPYHQLYMYKTNGYSIHGQGRFVHFKNNQLLKENMNFFKKITQSKVEFDAKYPPIEDIIKGL